jgi:hypothetical protein
VAPVEPRTWASEAAPGGPPTFQWNVGHGQWEWVQVWRGRQCQGHLSCLQYSASSYHFASLRMLNNFYIHLKWT